MLPSIFQQWLWKMQQCTHVICVWENSIKMDIKEAITHKQWDIDCVKREAARKTGKWNQQYSNCSVLHYWEGKKKTRCVPQVYMFWLPMYMYPCCSWRVLTLVEERYNKKSEFCHTKPSVTNTHTSQVHIKIITLINHVNADCVGLDSCLMCIFRIWQSLLMWDLRRTHTVLCLN